MVKKGGQTDRRTDICTSISAEPLAADKNKGPAPKGSVRSPDTDYFLKKIGVVIMNFQRKKKFRVVE